MHRTSEKIKLFKNFDIVFCFFWLHYLPALEGVRLFDRFKQDLYKTFLCPCFLTQGEKKEKKKKNSTWFDMRLQLFFFFFRTFIYKEVISPKCIHTCFQRSRDSSAVSWGGVVLLLTR